MTFRSPEVEDIATTEVPQKGVRISYASVSGNGMSFIPKCTNRIIVALMWAEEFW